LVRFGKDGRELLVSEGPVNLSPINFIGERMLLLLVLWLVELFLVLVLLVVLVMPLLLGAIEIPLTVPFNWGVPPIPGYDVDFGLANEAINLATDIDVDTTDSLVERVHCLELDISPGGGCGPKSSLRLLLNSAARVDACAIVGLSRRKLPLVVGVLQGASLAPAEALVLVSPLMFEMFTYSATGSPTYPITDFGTSIGFITDSSTGIDPITDSCTCTGAPVACGTGRDPILGADTEDM